MEQFIATSKRHGNSDSIYHRLDRNLVYGLASGIYVPVLPETFLVALQGLGLGSGYQNLYEDIYEDGTQRVNLSSLVTNDYELSPMLAVDFGNVALGAAYHYQGNHQDSFKKDYDDHSFWSSSETETTAKTVSDIHSYRLGLTIDLSEAWQYEWGGDYWMQDSTEEITSEKIGGVGQVVSDNNRYPENRRKSTGYYINGNFKWALGNGMRIGWYGDYTFSKWAEITKTEISELKTHDSEWLECKSGLGLSYTVPEHFFLAIEALFSYDGYDSHDYYQALPDQQRVGENYRIEWRLGMNYWLVKEMIAIQGGLAVNSPLMERYIRGTDLAIPDYETRYFYDSPNIASASIGLNWKLNPSMNLQFASVFSSNGSPTSYLEYGVMF